jgi:hypothetical protein
MKTIILCCLLALGVRLPAQIPVTDIANLTSNQIAHIENIAKWIESITQLKTQIDQLRQQIDIQSDLRKWSGNPLEASRALALDLLGQSDLIRRYGSSRSVVLNRTNSLDSLQYTNDSSFRAISSTDLDGGELQRDPLLFRRYAVLDATQANTVQVTEETKAREQSLQEEIARTLVALKSAATDAETQKLAAKLTALNGQVAQVETSRRREVDAVTLQKIANDARLEQERIAAAELAAKDDFLANQHVSAYMKTIKVRRHENP